MLALLLRSSVALALAAPPTSTPEASPTPQASPQSREYAGAEVSEAPPAPDDAVIVPPAPADATSEPVAALAPTVAPTVATTPSPAPTPEGPSEDEDAIDELPYDPLVDSPEAVRARHWVRSGAVFLALGAVLTIGAIAMSQAEVNNPETGEMNCNNRGDPAGNGCTQGGRTRSTVALAVPGALLLGGGVAMLTVGKLQQRRLAASVRADRQSFALGLSLRF